MEQKKKIIFCAPESSLSVDEMSSLFRDLETDRSIISPDNP
jgi:hypothetical protein